MNEAVHIISENRYKIDFLIEELIAKNYLNRRKIVGILTD